jgi:hypothetical protein
MRNIKEELKRYDNMTSIEKDVFIKKMLRTLHPDNDVSIGFEYIRNRFDKLNYPSRLHYLQNMIVKYLDGSQWDTDDYKFFFGDHYHTYFDNNDVLIKQRKKKSAKPKVKKRCKCK